jgi:hypothetical protein
MGVAYLLFVKGFVYIGKSTPSFIFTSSFLTSSKYPTKVYTNFRLIHSVRFPAINRNVSFQETQGKEDFKKTNYRQLK